MQMLPSVATTDPVDRREVDAKTLGKSDCRLFTLDDLQRVGIGQFCGMTTFPRILPEYGDCMFFVVRPGDPFQVCHRVVQLVTVLVVDLGKLVGIGYERQGDHSVDVLLAGRSVSEERHLNVAVRLRKWAQLNFRQLNLSFGRTTEFLYRASQAVNGAVNARFVEALKAWDSASHTAVTAFSPSYPVVRI